MSLERAPRGRPRLFDRGEALYAAMQIFWEHGYEGTSIALLSQELNLKPTSIYAAFGSKESLFKEAVALYIEGDGGVARRALEIADTRDSIEAMLKDTVRSFCRAASPRGCLLLLGDKGLTESDEAIRTFLKEQRAALRELLPARLSRGVEAGDLPADTDVDAMATMVLLFLYGVSIDAADGASESRLLKAVDVFLANWPMNPTVSHRTRSA